MQMVSESLSVSGIVRDIDRLIAEMTALRSRVSRLEQSSLASHRPIHNEEFFGMWADRADMQGKTSRQWLEEQRQRQWAR